MNERRSACCGSRYTRQDSSHRGHLHSTDGSYPSRAACHSRSSLRKHIGHAREARTSASGSSVRNLAVSASRTTESRMLAVRTACNRQGGSTPRVGEGSRFARRPWRVGGDLISVRPVIARCRADANRTLPRDRTVPRDRANSSISARSQRRCRILPRHGATSCTSARSRTGCWKLPPPTIDRPAQPGSGSAG